MKITFHTVLLLVITTAGIAQTFEIGHTTLTFTDASRGGRAIATEFYYPADVPGNNVAVTATSGIFPILAFGHGFVMTYDAYQNIWEDLVPKGFIMAFPKTEGGIGPSHNEFAKDLAYVITALKIEGQNPASRFYNRIGNRNAVMGHSMGGGAAFLAGGLDPQIAAIAVLAPAETNPSAIAAAATLSIPALVMAGTNDCVTPPAANQLPMYQALQSSCKTYVSINGGSHCQMANANFFCGVGESSCTPAPTVTRTQQHAVISNYLGNWLKATLLDDCTAGTVFDTQLTADSNVTFERNCLLCDPLADTNFEGQHILVSPNPFTNRITVAAAGTREMTFSLFDTRLRKIVDKVFVDTADIMVPEVPSGIYLYTLVCGHKVVKSGKLVKR